MNNDIIKQAFTFICSDWKSKLSGNESIEEMLNLFIKEPQFQEFCFDYNYPTIDQLQYIADMALNYNVVIDRQLLIRNPSKLFLFGNAYVEAICDDYSVTNITARDNAELTLFAKDNAVVYITTYGDNVKINQSNSGNATIKIFKRYAKR